MEYKKLNNGVEMPFPMLRSVKKLSAKLWKPAIV